jgi:hypothetical protein
MNQSRAARGRHGESEGGDLDALVADASERQALGAVRELGRRGLKVGRSAVTPPLRRFGLVTACDARSRPTSQATERPTTISAGTASDRHCARYGLALRNFVALC